MKNMFVNRWLLVVVCLACFCAALCNAAIPPRRVVAEWESALGVMIRWPLGIPSQLVVALSQETILYVLVETTGQQNQAAATFSGWGISPDRIEYVFTQTYSHWTRDYGPQFLIDSTDWLVVNQMFDGYPEEEGCLDSRSGASDCQKQGLLSVTTEGSGRPEPIVSARGWSEDDDTNIDFALHQGWNRLDLPLYFTGGNFMTDGYGMGFATSLMVNENNMSLPAFQAAVNTYLGLAVFHILDNPNLLGIQHIDCNAKLLNAETVLVKQLSPENPEYHCLERLAVFFAECQTSYGRPFTVHRIFCPSIDGASWETNPSAAYTNALILNDNVFVPLYGIDADTAALQTYRDTMPGYNVQGFYSANWYGEDALHCRAMGIFDPSMVHISHAVIRNDDALPHQPLPLQAWVHDYSGSGIVEGSVLLKWRTDEQQPWQTQEMTPVLQNGLYQAFLPAFGENQIVHYGVSAQNLQGKTTSHPAAGWHVFTTGAGSVPTPTPSPNCIHHGDVTLDGSVTASDAQLAFQIAIGVYSPTYEQQCQADCNANGDVTAGDAQQIFLSVLGLPPGCVE